MKDMRRLRFIVPLALCLLGAGCADRQAAPFRRSVMLTEPVQAGAGVLRTFPGTVREAHAVSLGFKTPGQIERVMVQEGDRVRHIKYGEGTVQKIEDGPRDYQVTVDFDMAGVKIMYAAFAKLKKI